ncbi:TRMT1-like protein [Lingula anatina]|uniref:TRMT1-like protein n=1 Tax=Lingula anatina TaxID=7574 RepID=A0A1S3HSF0_LINAN|nr:TRMT1-like protein [Lingula anatina]|eukprot:XP_013388962.1 TRMT1-like protein [Lingula anatina]
MEEEDPGKNHISIVRSVDELKKKIPVGSKIPCPLCPTKKFKPTYTNRVKRHLNSHIATGVAYDGYISLVCHLVCPPPSSPVHGHYHCPKCGRKLARKIGFINHLVLKHGRGGRNSPVATPSLDDNSTVPSTTGNRGSPPAASVESTSTTTRETSPTADTGPAPATSTTPQEAPVRGPPETSATGTPVAPEITPAEPTPKSH